MTYLIRQAFTGGIQIEQDENVINLSDDDIARIIRLRLLFERFTWNDLVFALTLFQNSASRKQVDYESVVRKVNNVGSSS